ncbi:C40 family peptidase [Bifidobacterium pullorum subsp. saeculare]|uniref:C40 family peptidase n=2 Tax=Bifidobacterium pullorum TaxID=78448 RepID=A0A939B8D3_9BIFI|nr:C40 family peptidase [Bifidobacterium pullorum subsp. saeculare]
MLLAGVASCALAVTMLPTATAAPADSGAVASSRSFPKANVAKRNILAESTATEVQQDADWGGIEDLNVPKTKSQAEKDAEAAAARAAQEQEAARQRAEQEAAQRSASARAASRSASRQSIGSGSSAPAVADAPVSGNGAAVVSYAMQFQGVPYVYGGSSPSGFDCSGFTQYVFGHFGISLGRTSEDQRGSGTRVSNPAPGDLMWKPGHVGIYVGNGMMIHATKPGDVVKIGSSSYYSGWEYYRLI